MLNKHNQLICNLVVTDRTIRDTCKSEYKAFQSLMIVSKNAPSIQLVRSNIDKFDIEKVAVDKDVSHILINLIINNQKLGFIILPELAGSKIILLDVIKPLDKVSNVRKHSNSKPTGKVFYKNQQVSVKNLFNNVWYISLTDIKK